MVVAELALFEGLTLNVRRSVFNVQRFLGAVRTSVTLLVQYMGKTFVFQGYVFLGCLVSVFLAALDLALKG
jgi:hypothetical protein